MAWLEVTVNPLVIDAIFMAPVAIKTIGEFDMIRHNLNGGSAWLHAS